MCGRQGSRLINRGRKDSEGRDLPICILASRSVLGAEGGGGEREVRRRGATAAATSLGERL